MRAGLGLTRLALSRLALSVVMLTSVLASGGARAQDDVETKELPPIEAPVASAPAAPAPGPAPENAAPTVSQAPRASSSPPAYEQPGAITPLPGSVPPASVDVSSARIQWRLENPFRLFVEPAATDVGRAMGRLQGDETAARTMGQRALVRSAQLSWEETVRQLVIV